MNIYVLILVIINFIFKGLFIGRSPNSLSLEEIDLMTKLNLHPAVGNYVVRFIPFILSTLVSLLSFYLISQVTKNKTKGFFFGICLAVSPWIVVLSRFVNPYIFFLFLFVLSLLPKNKWLRFITASLVIISFKLYLNRLQLPVFDPGNFFRLTDFRNLFFNGDPLSPSFRIPKTGFFLFFDLIALGLGFYYLISSKGLGFFFDLFLFGIFYYFITPDLIYTYKGLVIFYSLTFVIAHGYYYLTVFSWKKNRFFTFILLFLLLINIAFYQENFYNHFDKKTSYDWGYAETQTVKYVFFRPKLKKIYLTNESSKLSRYFNFFDQKELQIETFRLDRFSELCGKTDNSVCILREHEVGNLGMEKDKIKIKFAHYDGLPMYFLILKGEI